MRYLYILALILVTGLYTFSSGSSFYGDDDDKNSGKKKNDDDDGDGSNDKNAQATVKNLIRVGVHIYQTPPNAMEKSIKVLDLKPNPEIANAYDLVCKNTGEVMIECKAHLELAAANGEQTKLDFIEFPMFPEQVRLVTFELPKNLPVGKYNTLGILDAGEDLSLEAIESTVEVKAISTETGN